MTEHSWAVIGAGPAGIAAVGRLLDHGVAADEIAWIDPDFAAGDFGTKWHAVPGNTQVSLFLDYLNASPSFRFAEAPPFELNSMDPQQTCLLGLVAEPLLWITQHLCERVNPIKAVATELTLSNRRWIVRTENDEIAAKNVILAVGSTPKKLNHAHLEEIPIEVALDPQKLEQLSLDGATVAVFGSSHSTMVALPNLLATPAKKLVNFYLAPTKYAVYLDDYIHFDDTGLKGNAARWARENIDGTLPERLERYLVNSPEYSEQLQACTHAVYTVGFASRQPATPQFGALECDATNGILAPGLFGVGIAYPEYTTDPFGAGAYRIGLAKFMQRLETALPLWLRYGA